MKEGWTYKKVGDVFKTYSGGTPIKSHKEYYENGDIPWIRSGEVCRKYITKSEMFITQAGLENSSAKYFPIDTVLVAMYGATAAQVGILKIKATSNQAVCGILPNDHFIPEFVYYWFKLIESDLASQAQGGAQPNISQEKIKKVDFPIISLAEQERIVERLDATFAQIDELKSNAERQLAEARALFQSALTQAMQPKPGWQEKTLGEIANIIHGKNQKEVVSETGKYPIYGSGGNIMGYATDYLCEAGTTILGRKGSINNPQFINERFWNVDTAFGISAKEDNDNKFIYYFIKSVDWSKKNTGTTLPSLTQSVVKSVNLFVPNLTDQQTISSYLDSLHAQILEIDRVNKRTAAECDAMKQALLRQIFE